MKRWPALLCGGLGAVLLWYNLGGAAPVEGRSAPGIVRVTAFERKAISRTTFKGGERACVIVEGDHKPVIDLVLEIHDEKGNLVARDSAGGDICAAIWYPPRTGVYTVWVENNQNDFKDIILTLR
jgi:hypothetical protein